MSTQAVTESFRRASLVEKIGTTVDVVGPVLGAGFVLYLLGSLLTSWHIAPLPVALDLTFFVVYYVATALGVTRRIPPAPDP